MTHCRQRRPGQRTAKVSARACAEQDVSWRWSDVLAGHLAPGLSPHRRQRSLHCRRRCPGKTVRCDGVRVMSGGCWLLLLSNMFYTITILARAFMNTLSDTPVYYTVISLCSPLSLRASSLSHPSLTQCCLTQSKLPSVSSLTCLAFSVNRHELALSCSSGNKVTWLYHYLVDYYVYTTES